MPRNLSEIRFSRVVKFLMSLKHPKVLLLLATRGFDQKEREKGWKLFDKAAGRMIDMSAVIQVTSAPTNELLLEIDRWENEWFDVADGSLKYNYPEIHAIIFKNLSKTTGLKLMVSVPTMLRRLEDLEKKTDSTSKEAMALLEKRGLNIDVRDKGQKLIDKAKDASVFEIPAPTEASQEEQKQAAKDMWHWYLEWAQIGRIVVPSKRLRIMMGISSISRADEEENEEVEEVEEEGTGEPNEAAATASGSGGDK